LDDPDLGALAAKGLSQTILMFEAFFDVETKAKAGNKYAQAVMKSWAEAEVLVILLFSSFALTNHRSPPCSGSLHGMK
jgi:aconitase B